MTIIAAAKDEYSSWIASDSHGIGRDLHFELGTKIIEVNKYFIGFTCSYRVADIIREATTFPPRIKDMKDLRKFRDELKKLLIEDGCEKSAESDACVQHPVGLIIASEGNLYSIDDDYQIHEVDHYCSTGAGTSVALGAMRSVLTINDDPQQAVEFAVEAAIFHCSSCGGDVHFKGTRKPKTTTKKNPLRQTR